MPNCPLADDCPSFQERIQGMGCQHYGDRGGAEWCNHYNMPISELKQQPVQPGEEVIVEVDDIHESGAGVGRTDDGFIVLIDGLLPEARARVRIDRVKSNHATAKEIVERLPLESEEEDEIEGVSEGEEDGAEPSEDDEESVGRERLGSRENFWGG
ncbi:TRAM domain-containing protein [Halalkaliarchaeum sp. AArc-GB]|uniref:TRAM domain-containing protein n=1 Tax=Halalkaliarchaeum sp. AArc-GB TaxID=3074078 RepID=UPI0028605B4E|nr:TRAM domain-containing protein [Halalkaliarchaeum sp. AArc-GB]MDR5672821.1 TRAM domain-containing protein [Halalkaliarchaeum sp. AArc-GB]